MKSFAIRLTATVLLLLFSATLLLTNITAFPSGMSKDVDGEVREDGTLIIDVPQNGIAPFDGEFADVNVEDVSVSADAAFLCTFGGQVLYAKRHDARLPMASITKVMTALVVIENTPDILKKVKVSPLAVGIEGSSVYLKAGDMVTISNLLYALMLSSANDAAVALAIAVSGSVDDFVKLMNKKASELGMTSTAFNNPHGLSSEGHYTTARDYGVLMAHAIDDPSFREISGTLRKNISINGVEHSLYNHNRLLYSCEGVFSGKTGYTIASGRTLVTAAERNGVTLICVTLNASDDWNDHKRLFSVGFSRTTATEFNAAELSFEMPIAGGSDGNNSVSVIPERNVKLISVGDTEYSLRYRYPVFVYAPVLKGDRIGYITVNADGVGSYSVALIAAEEVASENSSNGILWRLSVMWRALTKKEEDSLHNE